MTQVGLTMFEYDRDTDSYTATGYTFHLCPQVVADIDQSFIFQASTLKFLCQHKFDFNKVRIAITLKVYFSNAGRLKPKKNGMISLFDWS